MAWKYLMVWSTENLAIWIPVMLIIWWPNDLRLSEIVWECLKVSDNVWRYSFLTDWLSGGLRITDNLMFWSSDVLKCLINSEKFWYQLFSDIQIIRESGHQRVSHSQTIRFLLLISDFFRRADFFRPSENLTRCWWNRAVKQYPSRLVSWAQTATKADNKKNN